ncbi:MAG: IS21 family transposase [Oscillospiraceae bacterium]|nr:IS21 family transposase [Oscillospiraceae bacterium]
MLSMRKIDLIRKYKFDLDMPVRVISYKVDVSPTSVYKYIKMDDFSEMLKQPRKKRPKKMDIYEPIIKEWLLEDKTRHYKQRHTAKRVFDWLNEMYEDFDISYATVATTFRRIKSEVYYVCKEYAPLRHLPGEAQVDLGNCDFVENGIKYKGCYVVMSFPYSNIAFCQILKAKNAQCIVQGMKNIFEFIGGVPHEITFDNESSIVRCLGEKITKRVENELFLRFKNHYDFRCEYCNSHSPNQKGHVEGKIGYLRRNLFVPQPIMQNLDEYNKELLHRCMDLHNRKHHRTKKSIIEMFDCDRQALLKLPKKDFEVTTCFERKVDREGRVRFNGQRIYYLEPRYAKKKVQVRLTYNMVTFYDKKLNVIAEFDRLYGEKNYTAIHWEQWLPTLSRRPNSLFHSSFSDMFTERLRQFLLGGTAKIRGVYMKALCELIKGATLDKALTIADEAAGLRFEDIDSILQLAAV